ncbi:MAG TPA: preprotein translocase subunit SecE [Terriglobia bacterium]|nr:preprotein translocase subunit SecE [Terriglobia bacterium]
MAEELTIQKSFWERTRDYFFDVRVEMKRVTWPSKQEIYGTTVMVILTTFLFAGYFAICDGIFNALVRRVLNYFLHRH